ncbi:MAG: hypothetical protein AAFR21_01710 [Pseudomonadota bacterium]
MSLETIYYIGQTVAVILILGSLVAIFWQQRQANKIAQVQNAAALSSGYASSLRDIINNADLAAIFRKAMFDDEELTPVEATQILLFFNQLLIDHRSIWLAHKNGLYEDQGLKGYDTNTAWYLSKPLFRAEWRRWRDMGFYDGPFGDHIERLIKKSP